MRRGIATRIQERIDEVADAMLVGYQREIDAYAQMDDPSAIAEVRGITRTNVLLIAQAVTELTPLSEQALAVLRELGRRRAHQGFPLHAILHAYQVGTRVAWRYMLEEIERADTPPDILAQVVAEVSIAILGLTAQVSGAVSQAFMETERQLGATEERVRRDVFEELLDGPVGGPEPLRERAEAIGYRLGEYNAVATVMLEGVESQPERIRAGGGGIWESVAQALRGVRAGLSPPITHARGAITVAIFPVDVGTPKGNLRRTLESTLEAMRLPAGVSVLGALGRVERGILGIPVSYRQALRTLDAARTLGIERCLCTYVEMLPSLMLMQDLSLGTDLWRSTVAPLVRHDTDQSGQLVQTLEALFEERGNLVATAKRLFVHRHTLSARLERIEELTGRSLRDRADVLLLELGLKAQAILPSEQPGGGSAPASAERNASGAVSRLRARGSEQAGESKPPKRRRASAR